MLAALRESHVALARVTLCEYVAGEYVPVGQPLPIEKGELSLDAGSNVWRTLNATVVIPPNYDQRRPAVDGLNVASAEVKLEMGVEFAPGDQEWVQVGQLRVESLDESLLSSRLELVAYDRAIRVADFPLVTLYTPRSGSGDLLTYVEAVIDLITVSFPSEGPPTVIVDPSLDDALSPPAETVYEGERWTAINDLAAAIGAVVYNDHEGNFLVAPAVPSGAPVWTIDVGETGVLIDANVARTREGQANAVALTCEPPSGDRIFVYLVDANPASATYYDGPFGRKPISRRNDTITDGAQAIEAAKGYLAKYLGAARAINFKALYNFLLLPMDAVEFVLTNGDSETHTIDGLSIPLGGGEMGGQTRVFMGVDDVS
jgi:hypothetical protein